VHCARYAEGNILVTKFPTSYHHQTRAVRHISTNLLVCLIVSCLVVLAWGSSGEAAQLIDLGTNTVAYNFSANGQYICGSAYRSGSGPFPVLWNLRTLQRHPANPSAAETFLNSGGDFGEAKGMGINGTIAGTLSSQSNLSAVGSDQPVSWNASTAASTNLGTSGRTSCISADGTTIVVNQTSTFNISYGQNYGESINGTGQVYACNQNGAILAGISGNSAYVWQNSGGALNSVVSVTGTYFATSLTGMILGGQMENSTQLGFYNSVFGMPQVSSASSTTINLVGYIEALLSEHRANGWESDSVLGLNNSGSIAVGQYLDSNYKSHGFRATFDKDGGDSGNDNSSNDSSALTVEDWILYKAGVEFSGGARTSGLLTYNAVGTDFDGDAVVGQLSNSGSAGDAYLAIDSVGL